MLVTEKKYHCFLYKKLSLDLLLLYVCENIRKSVMLLWEQGGIGNWIFFCRSLLCSDHGNKFHDESSHIMSQPRKVITTPWYSDLNSRYHSQKKCYSLKWKYLLESAFLLNSVLYMLIHNDKMAKSNFKCHWVAQHWSE